MPGTNAYRRLIAVLCVSPFCNSSELVHFSNGFTFQADSHIQRGDHTQFCVGSGTLEFPSQQIETIETLPSEVLTDSKAASPVVVQPKPDLLISEAASAQGIDAAFARSVAKVESGMQQASRSNKGAIGLMQLMPGTAKALGVDPWQPEQNAKGGAQYLRTLLLRYKGNSALALAAYNAGPGAIEKFHGIPPYRETRQYVVRVLQEYNRQRRTETTAVRSNQQIASRKAPSTPNAKD